MSFMKFKGLHLAIDAAEALFGLRVTALLYWGLTYDLSGSISHLHLSNSHAPRCVVLSADEAAPGQLSPPEDCQMAAQVFGANSSSERTPPLIATELPCFQHQPSDVCVPPLRLCSFDTDKGMKC